tara:strand:+ start:971 stop:2221 length:1251 start_codon:yes stop_codon:yes gene_type:complete
MRKFYFIKIFLFLFSFSQLNWAEDLPKEEPTEFKTGSIDIIPFDESKNKFLKDWIYEITNKVDLNEDDIPHSASELPIDVAKDTSKLLKSKFEGLATSNWNSVANCPEPENGDSYYPKIEDILLEIPNLLLKSLQKQSIDRVNEVDELGSLSLFIISSFMGYDGKVSSSKEAIALGTAVIGTTAVGIAYLNHNKASFTQPFSLKTPDSNLTKNLTFTVGGKNIGFNSKNPHLSLVTTFNFRDDSIFSISLGGSHVTNHLSTGTESAGIFLSIPVANESYLSQRFSLRAKGSGTRTGPLDQGHYQTSQAQGSITYSINPKISLLPESARGELYLGLDIIPISINKGAGTPSSSTFSSKYDYQSTANTSLRYRFIKPSALTDLGITFFGGAGHGRSGTIEPIFGAGFNITIRSLSNEP